MKRMLFLTLMALQFVTGACFAQLATYYEDKDLTLVQTEWTDLRIDAGSGRHQLYLSYEYPGRPNVQQRPDSIGLWLDCEAHSYQYAAKRGELAVRISAGNKPYEYNASSYLGIDLPHGATSEEICFLIPIADVTEMAKAET